MQPARSSDCHLDTRFTEGQISTVLRVVADETAQASYEMHESLIYRASRLSLATEPVGNKSNKKGSTRRGSSVVTSGGWYQDSSFGGSSEVSGAIRSDDDVGSLGYSYEYSKPGVLTDPPQPSSNPTCNRMDPGLPYGAFSADSPGSQTVAALKQEAVQDRQKRVRNPKGQFKTLSTRGSGTRRKMSKTCHEGGGLLQRHEV